MEYQKIANLLDYGVALSRAAPSASNQPSKFRINNWVDVNNESRGGYTTGSDIKFKTTILMSSLCDYADAQTYLLREH